MRSRPYRPPPPLPPLLDDLATYLPNSDHRRPSNDGGSGEVPLSEIDPESGRLLPKKKPQQQHLHRVRVQGKLALVRSVSVAELRPMGGGDGSPMLSLPRATMRHRGVALDSGVGAVMPGKSRRRCSLDDVGSGGDDDDDDSDDYDEEISERDTQPRGYGIGGAGNIRRPTEVMGRPTRSSPSLAALLSPSSIPSTSPGRRSGDRKRWNFREFMDRVSDRRGKGRVSAMLQR